MLSLTGFVVVSNQVTHVAPPVGKLPQDCLVLSSSSREGGRRLKWLANSTTTWIQLRLKDPLEIYHLMVAASHNQSVSAVARLRFSPYAQSTSHPDCCIQTK